MTLRDMDSMMAEITLAEIYEKGERISLAAQTKEGVKEAQRFVSDCLARLEMEENEEENEEFRRKMREDIAHGRYKE